MAMRKAIHSTDRKSVSEYQQIINIGPAMEKAFRMVELDRPSRLIGKDPFEIYERMCRTQGSFYDPCVLDCIWSAIDFMNGKPPKKWWSFTKLRKQTYGTKIAQLKEQLPADAG